MARFPSTALVLIPKEARDPEIRHYPEKVNPAIPDDVWRQLQDNAAIAAKRMAQMLIPANFQTMRNGDKMKLIRLALERGHGGMDGSVRRHLHLHAKPSDVKGINALTDLARLAQDGLPEFGKKAPLEVTPVEVPPAEGSAAWRAEKRLADKNRDD